MCHRYTVPSLVVSLVRQRIADRSSSAGVLRGKVQTTTLEATQAAGFAVVSFVWFLKDFM